MRRFDFAELVLLAALWGASFLFMRVAAPVFGPFALMELRCGIAALFLLPLLAMRGGLADLQANARPIFVTGVINSAIPFTLFAYAALSLTAGFSSIVNATAPFFAAIVAYFWLKERLVASRATGLVIGFVGVVLLVWDKAAFKAGGTALAVLAALGATLCYGIAANYAKRKLVGVNPLATATGSQVAAALVLAPFAIAAWPATMPSASAWAGVIVLAVACTGLAYILYFRLIANIGATRAVAVTFLIPVFGVLWGALFLSEEVTPGMILSGAVIVLGTALTTGFITPPAWLSRAFSGR